MTKTEVTASEYMKRVLIRCTLSSSIVEKLITTVCGVCV